MYKIKRLLSSKYAFWVILAFFSFQALIFAGSITRGIPADEEHHFGVIQLYSTQPLREGPFIHHQPTSSLALGDIQRTPEYMYHYILGNVVRLFKPVLHSDVQTLYFLRVINILLVVLGLLVLRKLLRELKVSVVYQNIVILLLSLTTIFVGIAAAVNYDNAVFLITNLFLLELVRFVKKRSAKDLLWLAIISAFGLLVKYNFGVIIVGGLLGGAGYLIASGEYFSGLGKSFKELFSKQKLIAAVLTALVILSLGLVAERYGGNLIKYHAISPACSTLHTESQCELNRIYRRDQQQHQAFDNFIANGGQVIYSPYGFAGNWLDQMYSGLFFYLGQKSINPTKNVQNLAAAFCVVSLIVVLVYYRRRSVLATPEEKMLAFIAGFYIATLFLFNLNSYLHSASFYGFQGRYLLPVMALVYLFSAKALGSSLVTLYKNRRKIIAYGLGAYVLVLIFYQAPLLVFYRGASPSWFTNSTRNTNIKIQNLFSDLKIAKKSSLPSSQETPLP